MDDLSDSTERTMSAFAGAGTFTARAILNSVLAAFVTNLLLRVLYERTLPVALAYFRGHANDPTAFRRPRGWSNTEELMARRRP